MLFNGSLHPCALAASCLWAAWQAADGGVVTESFPFRSAKLHFLLNSTRSASSGLTVF